jgi:hypothetical protein
MGSEPSNAQNANKMKDVWHSKKCAHSQGGFWGESKAFKQSVGYGCALLISFYFQMVVSHQAERQTNRGKRNMVADPLFTGSEACDRGFFPTNRCSREASVRVLEKK